MFERYAIYYAPEPDGWLDGFGCGWLGRDAKATPTTPFAEVSHYDAYADWIASPARYGLHGTLKAPFRLSEHVRQEDLVDALAHFSKLNRVVGAPALRLTRLGNFLALCPGGKVGANPGIDRLASACVQNFEKFRAPLNEAELSRRHPAKLNRSQRLNLHQWGYPYVFDEFRFHITLSGAIDDEAEIALAGKLLRQLLEDLPDEPFEISSLCLFADPGEGVPLQLIGRYPLAA